MKKIKYFIVLLGLFMFLPLTAKADTISDVNMEIDVLEDGSANIVETWDVQASGGSEWYKQYKNLKNMEISNFSVSKDGVPLQEKTWDVDESMSEKDGYYGINRISDGVELCFGKSDYQPHSFTMRYNISNFIFNVDDAQVIYFTLLPKATVGNFSVRLKSFYQFPDKLDVWGFGYKGYAYVKDGVVEMSNEETTSLNNDYVVLLAKFPSGTFKTENKYEEFNTFDDVLKLAKKGSFEYDYGTKESLGTKIWNIISFVFYIGLFILPFIIGFFASRAAKYGYKDNKKITKDNTPLFREIPCKKDIYYAHALIKLNEFGYKETNILGAIILKWIREDKIVFKNEKKGIFNKDTSSIDMSKECTFENDAEASLFTMMKEASGDNILEPKELEKWCKKHYSKFLNVFKKFTDEQINKLKSEGHIYNRQDKKECKYKNVMDDKIYEDSKQLFGLKLFFKEFTDMNTKETMEVKLWDHYLMFAYLFGMAEKVAKQMKNLYPKEIAKLEQQGMDIGTIMYIDHLSTASVHAATAARAAAQSYSGGGGGFSSGGGGGGSFGGGGSMGGR
ncbi:MAG: DUF2207 domain-containing protein [Bacilli bacterium]|nr:DUF2207 domain-containing protein [Bacilli bacterium]